MTSIYFFNFVSVYFIKWFNALGNIIKELNISSYSFFVRSFLFLAFSFQSRDSCIEPWL